MAEPDVAREAEGLLDQIADTALDDDYYVVRAGPYEQSREFNTVLTGVVLAVFALLVAIAALQTRTDRPATERERQTLISDVDARKKVVASREAAAEKLRTEVDRLRASVGAFDPKYEELRLQAADRAAAGPGLRVQVGPDPFGNPSGRISDEDLQVLVNGLWYAGAEAVSLNGNRIGSLTAIRTAGSVIKVNFIGIGPPYVVVALGDPESLQERFEQNSVGQYWASRRKDAGVEFDVARSDDLSVGRLPADRATLTHATAIKGDE